MSLSIALASKSPRRQKLLKEAGFQFRVVLPNIEENYPQDLAPELVPSFLSAKKAQGAINLVKDTEITLAADSIVILDKKIYEKPTNRNHAVDILQSLSGKTHQVITGVTLLSQKKEITFSSLTHVSMEPLTLQEINYYIDNFNPFDKAGAYGIQEWIGHCKISKIEGSYLNVMGLPVNLVYKNLKNFL
ncbi:MAG TPA: septum formation protein Maf [Saprospiraceae bacterium]|nr:septum formation protein Maf [Saprospiraceae bacterium]